MTEKKKGWTHSWPDNRENFAQFSESDTTAYTVAVPNLAGTIPHSNSPKHWRDTKKLLNYVKKLDGFLGIHPVPPRGTLLVFKTENDAKRARNSLEHDLKVQTGTNIIQIFIPREYAKGGPDHENN